MTPAALLAALAERDIRVGGRSGGSIRLLGRRRDLDDALLLRECRRHRWLFELTLTRGETGSSWQSCPDCGELHLTSPKKTKKPKTCRMTYGCAGTLVDVPTPQVVGG